MNLMIDVDPDFVDQCINIDVFILTHMEGKLLSHDFIEIKLSFEV